MPSPLETDKRMLPTYVNVLCCIDSANFHANCEVVHELLANN